MRRGKGRSFVGFLLTYFLTSILVSTCILVSLKCTVLKGNGIKEFIKSLDIGEVVQEVVNESIKSTSSENDAVVDSVNKLADKIITDDVINEVTDVMVDSIIEDKVNNIKQENSKDDLASTYEVIYRRFYNLLKDNLPFSEQNEETQKQFDMVYTKVINDLNKTKNSIIC